jgi:hypothetical protein
MDLEAKCLRTFPTHNRVNLFLWLVSLLCLLTLLVFGGYCWYNQSGHCSMDPNLLLGFYGLIFGMGVTIRFTQQKNLLPARMTEALGFAGMSFIIFVTHLNILNHYETWILKGMPERNPSTHLLLFGFLIGALGGSMISAYLSIEQKDHSKKTL